MRLAIFLGVCSLFSFSLSAQQVEVRGKFLEDSIKIGKPFPYLLTAKYPSDKNILFPDSTFSFTPFEYMARQYYPTKSSYGTSLDSCIYYLNSFEIDSAQFLSLPVFLVANGDSTRILTKPDTVWLQHLVTIATDSIEAAKLPLKVNNYYEPVEWLFNYPIALIIGGILIVIAVVIWIIFGKRIARYFRMKRLRNTFENYIQNFTGSLEQLKMNYSVTGAERTLAIWKKYLESLENKPFTKYTSKEIIKMIGNQSLAGPLHTVDKLIYAEAKPSNLDAFYDLKSYSEDCFHKKIQELNESKT